MRIYENHCGTCFLCLSWGIAKRKKNRRYSITRRYNLFTWRIVLPSAAWYWSFYILYGTLPIVDRVGHMSRDASMHAHTHFNAKVSWWITFVKGKTVFNFKPVQNRGHRLTNPQSLYFGQSVGNTILGLPAVMRWWERNNKDKHRLKDKTALEIMFLSHYDAVSLSGYPPVRRHSISSCFKLKRLGVILC